MNKVITFFNGPTIVAITIILALLGGPQTLSYYWSFFFPEVQASHLYAYAEPTTGHIDPVSHDYLIPHTSFQGDTAWTDVNIWLVNTAGVPLKNVKVALLHTPQSNIWYDFHDAKPLSGLIGYQFNSNYNDIREIGSYDTVVLKHIVSLSLNEYKQLLQQGEEPTMTLVVTFDGANEPQELKYPIKIS